MNRSVRTACRPTRLNESPGHSGPWVSFRGWVPNSGETFASRRFVLGPWRWMIIVYSHHPDEDVVAVLAVVDGRTSTSPLANR